MRRKVYDELIKWKKESNGNNVRMSRMTMR